MDKLPNPFIQDPYERFDLDLERFFTDIQPPPKFLTDPSREFLIGCGLGPVLDILDGH